jgi:tetratricopeptide (TPR) repeat protein
MSLLKQITFSLFILVFWAFVAINSVFSQSTTNVDSLKAVLNKYPKEDMTKAQLLITLSDALIEKNSFKEGLVYSEQLLGLAEKLNLLELKGDAFYEKARHLSRDTQLNDAFDLAEKALSIFEQLHLSKKMAETHQVLGRIYTLKSDRENAKKHLERSVALSEQINDISNKMKATAALGFLFRYLYNDYDKARFFSEQALAIAYKIKDRKHEALILSEIASIYYDQDNLPKAIEYEQKALKIYESMQNIRQIANSYNLLGHIFMNLQDNDKALDYFNRALTLAIKTDDKYLEADLYTEIATIYADNGRVEEAIVIIEKSIKIFKSIDLIDEANMRLTPLGYAYYKLKHYTAAYHCYQQAINSNRKTNRQFYLSFSLIKIGELYLHSPDSSLVNMSIRPTERYSKAEAVLTEALNIAKKADDFDKQMEALSHLSYMYEKNENYIKAYNTFTQYTELKDSISSNEVKKQITRKEIQYEFDKKETELKYQQQLTAEQLEKQRLLTVQQGQALTLNQQNLTLKEQALALSNKEKDLAHLAYLKEQAEKQEKTQQLSLSQEREKGKELDLKLKNSELSTKNLELSAQQKQNLYWVFL